MEAREGSESTGREELEEDFRQVKGKLVGLEELENEENIYHEVEDADEVCKLVSMVEEVKDKEYGNVCSLKRTFLNK